MRRLGHVEQEVLPGVPRHGESARTGGPCRPDQGSISLRYRALAQPRIHGPVLQLRFLAPGRSLRTGFHIGLRCALLHWDRTGRWRLGRQDQGQEADCRTDESYARYV